MGTFTCKNCPDRKVGCHSVCEKHIKEQAEHARIKAIADRNKSIERDHLGYVADIQDMKKRRGSRGRYHYISED